MRKIVFGPLVLLYLPVLLQAQSMQYDILTGKAPAGFIQKEKGKRLIYEKKDGTTFCQLHIWPAQRGSADPEANFKTDWNYFAVQQYGVKTEPEKDLQPHNGWQVVSGAGLGEMNGAQFIVAVSTFTQQDISWCAVALFNDEKYTGTIDQFLMGITADIRKFKGTAVPPAVTNTNNTVTPGAAPKGLTKTTTNFDDGWQAKPAADYVQVKKGNTEIRLYYVNDQLDNARPNTIDAPEYYWSKYIAPYFHVPNPQKWSGVEYPVIYFMEGKATNKQTGSPCFVAIKIIYEGGARPVVVIAPDQNTYRQLFPHPNDLNRMLAYNKFAITANDVVGHWSKAGGGGVEYYNAYTGTYAGMSAISTTDEFTFNANGTYSSVHNSASTNNGGTQFAALKYNGRFTVTDWELTATNRVSGKPKKFFAQMEAVKGGYILILTDSDYQPLRYTLFKTK